MDGNSVQRGRHRRRARPGNRAPSVDPQWTAPADRPLWSEKDQVRTDWFARPEAPRPAADGGRSTGTTSWPRPVDRLSTPPAVPQASAARPDADRTAAGSTHDLLWMPPVRRDDTTPPPWAAGPIAAPWSDRTLAVDQTGPYTSPPAEPAASTPAPWGDRASAPWGEAPAPWGDRADRASAPWGEAPAPDRADRAPAPWGEAPAPWGDRAPVPWGEASAPDRADRAPVPWGDASAPDRADRAPTPWGEAPAPDRADGPQPRPWPTAAGPAGSLAGSPAGSPVGLAAVTAPPARSHQVKHPVRLALYCLVLLGLVAGTAAWVGLDKSVRLSVDGEPRALRTYASTVAGVLDDVGLTVNEHDVLAPGPQARVSDGSEIVLRRGRLLRMTVDGQQRQVWVTATTVQEALDQVGYRQNGLFVSANRSHRLPLDGYELTLRTPKAVTIVADGRTRRLTTTAATVGETLDAAGIEVDGDDKVSQLASAPVVANMSITVTRVLRRTETVRTELRFTTTEKLDPRAAAGSRKVATRGIAGLQEVTYVVTYVNGKLTARKIASVEVVRKPVAEVVVVGPEPSTQPPTQPPTQPAECADIPTTGGLNWCALAKCESGLNPAAYNPAGPYYGLYQFDQGTWNANGGTGSPAGASIAEQTRVAYNLYLARGASPWPTCGRYL